MTSASLKIASRALATMACLIGLGAPVLAAPLHVSLSFGDRSGPNASTLQSTSLAAILRGDGEGLFSTTNLPFASFSGSLGNGSVTSVGAIGHDAADPDCIDKCRRISGNLFQGGQISGSYLVDWYFNDELAPAGEFPPGSGVAPLKGVQAHPVFPGSVDYPGFLAAYTPYALFADLYNAKVTINDVLGNAVFSELLRSSNCTEVGARCSAFEVTNDFEKQFSNPVDGLFMHFEGPVFTVPEPGTWALICLALFGMRAQRSFRSRRQG